MEKTAPVPQGKYVPATRFGRLIFTAGMTPRKNGILILSGKVAAEGELEQYRDAVNQAVSNALIAAQNMLAAGESIQQVLQLTVYVNAEQGFQKHSRLADLPRIICAGNWARPALPPGRRWASRRFQAMLRWKSR